MTRVDHTTRAATAVLFVVMVAHALLETARDALFLAKLGPDRLALAYLAIAGTALVTLGFVRTLVGIREPRRLLVGFVFVAAAGTALLAILLGRAPWAVFALYIWTGFVATLVVPCFWTAVDRAFTVERAKRAFAVIGAGGVVGALVGSGMAAVLGRYLPPRQLVTVGAIVFGLATLVAAALAPRSVVRLAVPREPDGSMELASVRARRYVRLLAVVGVLSTVTLTLGDLLFKRMIAERLDPEALAPTLGALYTMLNLVGLAVQLVVAPRVLARFGVGPALALLPAFMFASALGFAATGAFFVVIVLEIGEGGMRHSLHRVANEILFLPVPPRIRDRTKPIADAFGHRGGQSLAAVVTLGLLALGAGPSTFALVIAGVAVAWLAALLVARRAYVAQFRDMLRAGELRRELRELQLDGQSRQLLLESLAAPDEVEALAAVELLGADPAQLPALVLYHPRKRVVARALELLAEHPRPDVLAVLDYLLEHSDPEIRAEALASSIKDKGHRAQLAIALEDAHPMVRATALVGLAGDAELGDRVAGELAAMQHGTAAERAALAHAIGFAPHVGFRQTLLALLEDPDLEVTREVLHVYERAPVLAVPERVVPLLESSATRSDARRVLVALGPAGLDLLAGALDDPHTSLGVRRHLPRTISRFANATAADALVRRLLHEPDGTTEYKLLRALGRMRVDDPDLALDLPTMRRYTRRAVARAARYATLLDACRASGESSPSAVLLFELLGEKRRNAVEHAFRALGIVYPRAGLRSVHAALASTDEVRRSAAREVFDDLVPLELRTPLLAILEDAPPDARRAALGPLAPGPFSSFEVLLVELLEDTSESIRCVVAHLIAERRLESLRPALQRQRPLAGSELVLHAFDQALARLAHETPAETHHA